MSEPTIHGNRRPFSDSQILDAIGKPLGEIKTQDNLTWTDIGKVLGVSEDQAANYFAGTAAMKITAFARGKREWNGRFTGYLDRLCIETRPGRTSDSAIIAAIIHAAGALAQAKANGDEIFDWEISRDRAVLEAAHDYLGELLGRVTPG